MKETGMGAKRWMIFSVAFLLLLGGLWLRERREREMWQNLAEAEEREAFSALAEGTDALALALGRTALASGERTRAMAAAETLGAAARAKSALAALNCQGDAAIDFVSRCEDYALWLLRGGEADAAGLKQLAASAEALSGAVTELQAGALSGELTREGLAGGFAECLAAWDAALPALQYDGALSAGESAAPASLAGREEITPEEALSAAARFTGLAESVFTVTGERESALPVYLLTAGGRWNTLTLEVTKRGGEVLYYGSTRLPAEEKLTLPEAEAAARAFLRARGFAELEKLGHEKADGLCWFRFAPMDGETLCCPDLLRVAVALDTGEVLRFESGGYLTNHTARENLTPALAAEEVAASASGEIAGLRPAIRTTPGGAELVTWEVTVLTPDGRRYLSYLNGETGDEEELLILTEDENRLLAR